MSSSQSPETPLRLAVLVSGSGSNLQALIDAITSQQLPGIEIALVVSNNARAYGLQRALNHALPTVYLPWNTVGAQFIAPNPDRITPPKPAAEVPQIGIISASEALLISLLHLFHVDLIVLAGWMRILSAPFLAQFPHRVINLHPALLPDDGTGNTYTTADGSTIPVFRGLHAVRQALAAGVKVTGSTVHYVTPEVDAGPVICREEVLVEPADTEESLHERVKKVEHRLIVEAVRSLHRRDATSK
jgi:phosphoribosylglycinamide formyltransferase 1